MLERFLCRLRIFSIKSVLIFYSFQDIRKALHEMFGRIRVTTKITLKMLVEELLNNLKKYPQDKLSIWKLVLLKLFDIFHINFSQMYEKHGECEQ